MRTFRRSHVLCGQVLTAESTFQAGGRSQITGDDQQYVLTVDVTSGRRNHGDGQRLPGVRKDALANAVVTLVLPRDREER